MYKKRGYRKGKKHKNKTRNTITQKDKVVGIISLFFLIICAFLLYYFVLKGNIHKH